MKRSRNVVGGALLAVAGPLAIVFSPLILRLLAVSAIVRPLRRNTARNRPAGGATITR